MKLTEQLIYGEIHGFLFWAVKLGEGDSWDFLSLASVKELHAWHLLSMSNQISGMSASCWSANVASSL